MASTRTINITVEQHEQLKADAAANGGLGLYKMFGACQRAWHLLTPEQQLTALRGDDDASVSPADARGCIQSAANSLMRGSLDLDALVDEAVKDQKLNRTERNRIRRTAKAVIEKACAVAAHVNEPATV